MKKNLKIVEPTPKKPAANFMPHLPRTEEEKAEAFRLLEELLKESARQEALREVLVKALGG
jgi:hypothetical protein